MKNGILLTGGSGTRLSSITKVLNKHMIPLKNKFVIDYSLATIKSAGVSNLTVVLGGNHFSQVVSYLKDGADFDININYCFQNKPAGIAQAINLCQRFVADDDKFVVVLGDNIFQNPIRFKQTEFAQIVLCKHEELNRFGVASIQNGYITNIEEKPHVINEEYDNYAITGCYLFDQKFFHYFKKIKPSARNEYEIAHIIDMYRERNALDYVIADGWWNDAGEFASIEKVISLLDESK